MPKLIPINHNCSVWVKLNDTGIAAYRRKYKHDPEVDENGFVKFNSFWQFNECFHQEIATGKCYMETGDFYMDADELKARADEIKEFEALSDEDHERCVCNAN